MKRTMGGIVFLAAGPLLIAGVLGAGLEGSKHDFRKAEWAHGDACIACHTPETKEPPATAPLWDPRADLNRTFGTSLYRSRRAGMGTTLCVRCHDGTVARDVAGRNGRSRFPNRDHPAQFAVGHGTSEHPVGVDYPLIHRGYRPINLVSASGVVPLPDGKVECVSCHDPHNFSGQRYMLVMSNAGSALCLSCHRK